MRVEAKFLGQDGDSGYLTCSSLPQAMVGMENPRSQVSPLFPISPYLSPPSPSLLLTPSCSFSLGFGNGAFMGAGAQPGKAQELRSMGTTAGLADMGAQR